MSTASARTSPPPLAVGDPQLLIGQRVAFEQLRDALPGLDLDEQRAPAVAASARASAPATVVLPVPPFPVTT